MNYFKTTLLLAAMTGLFLAVAERNPATAHMFIVNPLSGKNMDNLFSTHPNTENRITALQELARQWQMEDTPPDGPWSQQSDYSQGVTPRGPWG